MNEQKTTFDLSSLALHLIAMALMLCDHLWATVVPGHQWLTILGRLAFPIFAFLIAEGYAHTRDVKRYIRRLLLFAVLSEVPFNLTYVGVAIYPFHQNVLWTFIIALLCLRSIDKIRSKCPIWAAIPLGAVVMGLFMLLAQLTMTDYYGCGVLMVVLFSLLRGSGFLRRAGQLVGMVAINWLLIKGQVLFVPLFGLTLEIPVQGFAVLALPIIWLYRGRQGKKSRAIQYLCYAFYPVHMLILGLL